MKKIYYCSNTKVSTEQVFKMVVYLTELFGDPEQRRLAVVVLLIQHVRRKSASVISGSSQNL